MSVSAELQKLLYDTLRADTAVSGFVNGRVYDSVPASPTFPYISFGPYDFVPDDADCIAAGEHTLQLDIWSNAIGRVEAKRITDAVRRALHEKSAVIPEYPVVQMRVVMTQVLPDPDGKTSHGVVQVTASIEEPA